MKYSFRECESKGKWNRFVKGYDNTTFIDSWTWGDFENLLGSKFHRVAVYRDDDMVAALPIKKVTALRGRYLHLRHAPVMDWEDVELAKQVVKYLRRRALRGGWHFVRMSPPLFKSPLNQDILEDLGLIESSSHDVDAENTLVVDLTKTEEELMSYMRKNTRYYIRRAKRDGISVITTSGMENFDTFWEIFIDSVDRNDWAAYSKDYVKTEYELFSSRGMSRMFFSMYEDKAIAAAIFTYFNGQSFYHHSGSLSEYRDLPATYPLIWEAMKYAKDEGYKKFNLWGVSPEDDKEHPWYGLSLFKRGFGGGEVNLVHAKDLIVYPFAHITRAYERWERKRRGY
jgi:lipid II:glycine glycyltransferase (peptidoglycan interpeptide bridge formation enzyme)